MKIPTDWTFNRADVARGFDAHVREQLPWYDLATGAVAHIARHFIPDGGMVYDIGASTGNIGRSLAATIKARRAEYVGIEASPQMAKLYAGPGRVDVADARSYKFEPFDVAVLFLVLMFVPLPDRKPLLGRLCAACKDGGAIIVVDKVHPPHGWLGTVYRRLTLAGKVATRTDARQIVEKELSLSGVQRPIDEFVLPVKAQEFFKFGEFAGWVIAVNSNSKYNKKVC